MSFIDTEKMKPYTLYSHWLTDIKNWVEILAIVMFLILFKKKID